MEEFPSIEQCIKSIKDIGYNSSIHSPNLAADLLTAIIGFLGYLDRDRKYMQSNISKPFPKNDEIPALSAIFEDSALFAVFLSMLSSKPKNVTDFSAIPLRKGHTGGFKFKPNTNDQLASMTSTVEVPKTRKRSLSTSSATSVEHSPKKILYTDSLRNQESSKSSFSSEQRMIAADVNFSVLAAITFHTAFVYLEYWPAIFAQLYAEDCFGPRTWVDDKRCEGFVSIISSVIKDDIAQDINDLDKANAFHREFETFLQSANFLLSNSKSYERLLKAASNYNQYEFDSDQHSEEAAQKLTTRSMGEIENCNLSNKTDDDSSFSDEEEIEEEAIMSSLDVSMTVKSDKLINTNVDSNSTSNWWKMDKIVNFGNSDRYVGANNKKRAQLLMSKALEARLNEKVKQNSSLLTSLKGFLIIPHVRSLVASHLEKWLQSPALSGLARALFVSLVDSIENIDPLLPEDIMTLKSVLVMSLKQHQSQIRFDNIIKLVQRIPTLAVTKELFLYALNDKLKSVEEENTSKDSSNDDSFDLLKGIFKIVPVEISHHALAYSILSILNRWGHENSSVDDNRVFHLCLLLDQVVLFFGDKYDGIALISRMLSENSLEGLSISRKSISRVLLYAVLWVAPTTLLESDNENSKLLQSNSLMQKILRIKKIILKWYLRSFTLGGEVNSILHGSKQPIVPIFDSVLTGEMQAVDYSDQTDVLLCLMFVMDPNSEALKKLICNTDQAIGIEIKDYAKRMRACIANGQLIDDELLHIFLTFANDKKYQISGADVLNVIEHMISACSNGCGASVHIEDEKNLWELLGLSKRYYQAANEVEQTKLACPGLWWRVMVIALVICGKSTHLAELMWDTCPTLQMLMKMVITNRFTFPTVDCDVLQKYSNEQHEYNAQKAEYELVEKLFLPKEQNLPNVSVFDETIVMPPRGIRYSARQKEKQMKLLNIELQKQRELKAAEEQRKKHLLKTALKSIILFDPRGPARKPPPKLMKMLPYICDRFQLPAGFIHCSTPDFVLKTIGNSSRYEIEKAYDWLIPIISVYPFIIDRLPSTASCFLLLRTYGKRGKDSEKLLKLSMPLLDHVKRSISGELGDDALKRAVDLIFEDIKSNDSERRNCARSLLNDALVDAIQSKRHEQPVFFPEHQWLISLTKQKKRTLVLDHAIPCLSEALLLEQDKTLRAYIFALKYYYEEGFFPCRMDSFDFQLMKLIYKRPISMSAAIYHFEDVRNLCTHVLFNEVCINPVKTFGRIENESKVTILFSTPQPAVSTVLSLYSFKATIVLLSIWPCCQSFNKNIEIETLLSFLFPYIERNDRSLGAAGAKFVRSDKFVLTMEDWISLVKSPCECIATRAIQAAPDYSLVQFLFSCGLSSNIVKTVLKRLEDIFKKCGSSYECFAKYTAQKAIDKWPIGRRIKRNEVIRILYGRLKAYLSNFSTEPNSFYNWLYEENRCNSMSTQRKFTEIKNIFNANNAKCTTEVWAVFDDDDDKKRPHTSITTHTFNVYGSNEGLDVIKSIVARTHSNDLFGLRTLLSKIHVSHVDYQLILVSLLKVLAAEKENKGLLSAILQVIPLLDIKNMNEDLFETLVLVHSNASPRIHDTFQTIFRQLIRILPDSVVKECQSLIISYLIQGKMAPDNYGAVLSCFLLRRLPPLSYSTGGSFHINTDSNAVAPLAHLALCHGSRTWSEDSIYFPRSIEECSDWILFLLLLKSDDKECVFIVSQIVIDYKSPSKLWDQNVLPGILLHLYAINPERMNSETSKIHNNLTTAVAGLHKFWRIFSTPLDDQFKYSIDLMDMQTLQTQTQIVQDFVKRFPFVALKHILDLKNVLNRDATARPQLNSEKCRQCMDYPYLYAISESSSTMVRVSIIHWGVSFSEPLWIAVLDVLLLFPNELLFKTGLLFGLQEVLYMYIKLFKTQMDIQHEHEESNKLFQLRNKFIVILDRYKCINENSLNEWIKSTCDDCKIGTVLVDMGCIPNLCELHKEII